MARCLMDPRWRVCSGYLYKIKVKDATGDTVIPFRPNRIQRRILGSLWHRNVIVKARQLGCTTLIAILFLDYALFNADQNCKIVAQDRPTAQEIFRDKVKLAYERMPAALQAAMPLKTNSATELLFAHNNSSIAVATSARGGTTHRLHVSEMGKIGAKWPQKAREIMTGTLPSMPKDSIAILESTAEGQQGEFYEVATDARELQEQGKTLSQLDFRLHFYAWWQEPTYRLPVGSHIITDKDHEYFDGVEAHLVLRVERHHVRR
jgi:hypothetical protein